MAECGGGGWWRSAVAECGGGVWWRSVVAEVIFMQCLLVVKRKIVKKTPSQLGFKKIHKSNQITSDVKDNIVMINVTMIRM
jgi:hypothetical protein